MPANPCESGAPGGNRTPNPQIRSLSGSYFCHQRTQVGKALALWRRELVADLGGAENLSKQEHVIVEQITRLHLIIESIDGWLFVRPKGNVQGFINRRTQALLPVVRERTSLVWVAMGPRWPRPGRRTLLLQKRLAGPRWRETRLRRRRHRSPTARGWCRPGRCRRRRGAQRR
jgi:hypothetical protein